MLIVKSFGPFLFSFNNSFHSCSVLFCFLYVLWFYSFLNYVPSVLFTFITFSFVTNNELISIIFASCFICMYVCVCVPVYVCVNVFLFLVIVVVVFFYINLWLIREQWTWENSENGGPSARGSSISWEDVRSHAHAHTHTHTHTGAHVPFLLLLAPLRTLSRPRWMVCFPFFVLGCRCM